MAVFFLLMSEIALICFHMGVSSVCVVLMDVWEFKQRVSYDPLLNQSITST